MMYSQWSLENDGAISRPVRPPSPLVLWTFGTVPMVFLAPVFGFRCTMACTSRWLYSSVPSGRVTRPQTTSSSVPTCFAAQTSWTGVHVVWPGVLTSSSGVLPSLSFLLKSDAVTWRWYVVPGVSPSSRVLAVASALPPMAVRVEPTTL